MTQLAKKLMFRGKDIETMTREELIEAVQWAAERIRDLENGDNFAERLARVRDYWASQQ